jgi:hypothetical protein
VTHFTGKKTPVYWRRQGRVWWGRPLLSRPRGAVGFGLAAVESAAASVVGRRADVRGVCCWWVWLVVRFVCVPLCVRVSRVSRVCPGFPRCLFTGISNKRCADETVLQKVKRTLVLHIVLGRWSWQLRQRKWRPKSRQGLPR